MTTKGKHPLMTTTTVPLQITVDGVDTFNGLAAAPVTLRAYTPALDGSRAAVDLQLTHDVAAETIADLAFTLRQHPLYGALADRIEDWFDA